MTKELSAEEVKQLLTRCWMTHDAMWFVSALSAAGIAGANQMNKNAIRSLAPLEVRRFKKALGIEEIADLKTLEQFFIGTMNLAVGDFMSYSWEWRPDDTWYIEMERCFAHEGIQRLGVIAEYECGIFERIYAWLDALGVKYTVEPRPLMCMMHHEGHCHRHFKFDFSQS